jgi:hypothetical protein
MAGSDIIDDLALRGGQAKKFGSCLAEASFSRTITVGSGWIAYGHRTWDDGRSGEIGDGRSDETNKLLCELLPRHPEIDTVVVEWSLFLPEQGLTCILSPTIKHVHTRDLYMIPHEAWLETLTVGQVMSVAIGGRPQKCCRCQTLTILRLSVYSNTERLKQDLKEWGGENGARQLVVKGVSGIRGVEEAEIRRVLGTFTPYEEDEDEILAVRPAATRVPCDDE